MAGTQTSGVVTRNDNVVQAIRTRRKLPTAETCGAIGYEAISTPISKAAEKTSMNPPIADTLTQMPWEDNAELVKS